MKLKLKAIGKGTEDDPIRPDLDSIQEISNLNKALDEYKKLHKKELTDITFYTVQVVNYDEKTQELEVEIKVNKDIADKLPEPVKTAFKNLCSWAERSGT